MKKPEFWKTGLKGDKIYNKKRGNMIRSILKFTFGIIVGAVVGTVTASLLTPKSGEKIREDIRNGFDEIRLDYEIGKQKKREELEADLKQRCGE